MVFVLPIIQAAAAASISTSISAMQRNALMLSSHQRQNGEKRPDVPLDVTFYEGSYSHLPSTLEIVEREIAKRPSPVREFSSSTWTGR